MGASGYAYIETHAHLDFEEYAEDREQLIGEIFASGCQAVVNPGINIATSKSAIELAQSHERIFAGVGIHPHEAMRYLATGDDVFDFMHRDIETLAKLAEKENVLAIGECGLDYYRIESGNSETSKVIELQKDLLRLQLEVAKKQHLPVILHIREAHEDALEILDMAEHVEKGVAHCYEGAWAPTEVLLSRGFYIGFTGNITYPKKAEVHEVIRKIPIERIVLETDSPFLSPQVRRGKRNDPRSVVDVGKAIAEIKGLSEEEVFRQTTTNAITLFSLPVL